MAKSTTKMTKNSTENVASKTVVQEAPVVPPLDLQKTAAPKKVAANKAGSTKSKVPSPAEEVISNTRPVEVASVEPVVSEQRTEPDTEVSILDKLSVFSAKLHQLSALFSKVKTDYKVLEKDVVRQLKNAQKSSRRKKSSGNRQPSGFVKPTLISDELAQFLNKVSGTEMARTDVSKEINAYIRTNSLQDKTNGRRIIADTKLARLLKLGPNDELTYFNLQRYMKHHFIKTDSSVTSVGAVATA